MERRAADPPRIGPLLAEDSPRRLKDLATCSCRADFMLTGAAESVVARMHLILRSLTLRSDAVRDFINILIPFKSSVRRGGSWQLAAHIQHTQCCRITPATLVLGRLNNADPSSACVMLPNKISLTVPVTLASEKVVNVPLAM